MQESLICAPAVKGAWKHFPHEVARDTEVTAALLVVLAYRATFAGQYCLRPELLARLVSKGLSRDVVRSALALGAERGYLKRHQGPGAAPGKFGKVREVLDLPKCGESGRAGQMIKRSWFDGTLSVKDLAALLYLRAGTGKGNRSYTRELQERFGWSRSTAEGVIRTLTRRGLIEKHVTRNAAGQFKATTYSASQIAADRLSPSTAQKTVHVAAGDAKTGHLLTSSTPLDELSTRDNPKRTASAASYASPLRGQCATPQEAEAQEDFQCEVQDDVRSDAHCSQALLGWIEGAYEGDIQAALEDADSDVLAEIRAAVPDDRLSELVLDATGRRVAAEIISPPGLYAIRYLAAKLVLDDEDPEQAVVRVLNAMWARVGRHPGVWLNSLKLIGMRIGGELLGSGFDALYAGSGRPKFCVQSSKASGARRYGRGSDRSGWGKDALGNLAQQAPAPREFPTEAGIPARGLDRRSPGGHEGRAVAAHARRQGCRVDPYLGVLRARDRSGTERARDGRAQSPPGGCSRLAGALGW
jgi:hypothetical protein